MNHTQSESHYYYPQALCVKFEYNPFYSPMISLHWCQITVTQRSSFSFEENLRKIKTLLKLNISFLASWTYFQGKVLGFLSPPSTSPIVNMFPQKKQLDLGKEDEGTGSSQNGGSLRVVEM